MITETGCKGITGDFSSYAMHNSGSIGYVFTDDGDIIIYDEDSGTMTKP